MKTYTSEELRRDGWFPIYLNIFSKNGRELIKAYWKEEHVIKYIEKLCDDLVVYTKIGDEIKELFDIAVKTGKNEIVSLRTVAEQCEDGQFENTLEILLDNSLE